MAAEMKELRKLMARIEAEGPEKSSPGGYYCKEGDSIFYHDEDVPSYAQWADDLLTLYRAMDNHRIVGLQIKGIKRLVETYELIGQMVKEKKGVNLGTVIAYTFTSKSSKDVKKREPRGYLEALEAIGKRQVPLVELQDA